MICATVCASSCCDCWLCRDHIEGQSAAKPKRVSAKRIVPRTTKKDIEERRHQREETDPKKEGGGTKGTSGCKDGASNRAVEGGSMVWHVAHCEETSGFSVDSPNRLFHSHRRVSPRVVWGGPEGSRGVESDTCSTPLTTDSDERDMKGALPSRRFNRSRQECFYGCLMAGTGFTPLRAERFWGDTVCREWFYGTPRSVAKEDWFP